MQDRPGNFRRLCALTLGCAVPLTLGGAVSANDGDGEPQTNVTVTVTNLRSSEGVVRACMTTNADRFPKCRGDTNAHSMVVNAGKVVSFTFTGVKPGRYAIAVLHDENNNGKADRALMMMPKEGYGFSRDAKVRMGPPKFKDAAFDVTTRAQSQTIRMRYML